MLLKKTWVLVFSICIWYLAYPIDRSQIIKKIITLIRNFIRVRIAALLTFFQAMFYFYRRTLHCTELLSRKNS